MHPIFFHKKAAKELKKLDAPTQARVKKEIATLQQNPRKGKHLRHANFWRLRIGDYRAIYEIKNQTVIVLFVGHRKNVYDDFGKLA